MDQGLKERLVGAAVLVAIAVWLIPWVLDGPEAPLEATAGSLQLPAAEEPMPMRTQTLRLGDAAEPERRIRADRRDAAAGGARPRSRGRVAVRCRGRRQRERPNAAAACRADPSRQRGPERAAAARPLQHRRSRRRGRSGDWTVQLGSFSDEANARRWRSARGTFGYKAEVSPIERRADAVSRRVGPARRGPADAAASALKAHGIEDARVVAAR